VLRERRIGEAFRGDIDELRVDGLRRWQKQGLIQCRLVAANQSAMNAATVIRLVATLLPCPGTPNVSPGRAGFFASMRGPRPGLRGGWIGEFVSICAASPCNTA
jgi:hypothetical protein